MKALVIALSFFGFLSAASADTVLVNCYDQNNDGDIRSITVTENNLGELVAQVVQKNNYSMYKVEAQPAMLGGEYYATLFDTYKFISVNGDFRLDLCVSAGCTIIGHGSRPGKVKGQNLDQANTPYASETLACLSGYTSLSK